MSKSPRDYEVIAAVLDAIAGQYAYWLKDSVTGRDNDRVNTAYNEGVSAAEEAVVKTLREMGYAIVPEKEEAQQ